MCGRVKVSKPSEQVELLNRFSHSNVVTCSQTLAIKKRQKTESRTKGRRESRKWQKKEVLKQVGLFFVAAMW